MNNRNKNWNCDNDYCREQNGEIRRLPTGGNSAALLCHACYEHEIRWRVRRNKELEKSARFDLPAWEALEIYGEDK